MPQSEPIAFRAAELTALGAIVLGDTSRVAIVGAPGVGKSALARAYAQTTLDASCIVDLSDARHAADVHDALAEALGSRSGGVLALVERGAIVGVMDDVRTAEVAAAVVGLSEAAPEATLVVTTRDRALVRGLPRIELAPLSTADASALLLQFTQKEAPTFTVSANDRVHLEAIATHLGGVPLALQLAAARLPILGARALRFRLEKSFDVLARTTPDGQVESLRLAVSSSFETLTTEEHDALGQLSLFGHEFSAESAEAVVLVAAGAPGVLDVLQTLRDRSLLWGTQRDGELRLRVPPTVASFAVEAQGAEARAAFDTRHADHFAALAERADRATLVRERHHLLDVARRILEVRPLTARRAEPALRALLALGPVLFDESPHEVLEALATPTLLATRGSGARPALVAGLQWLRGALARRRGRDAEASSDLVAALSLARTVGDRALEGRALHELGYLLLAKGEVGDAEAHFVAAAEALTDEERARALAAASSAARERGDALQAKVHLLRGRRGHEGDGHAELDAAEAALALDEGRGEDARRLAKGAWLGLCLQDARDYDGARAAFRAEGATGLEGILAMEEGHAAEALVLLEDALGKERDPARVALFAAHLGELSRTLGRAADAARHDGRARDAAKTARRPFVDAVIAIFARRRGPSVASVHVRVAERCVASATPAAGPADDALLVATGGAWFRPPRGARVSLATRKNLARLVEAFAARGDETFTSADLVAVGWPGERILGPAGTHRVRVAIATLRKMGLESVIVRRGDGYGLAEGLPVERVHRAGGSLDPAI